MLKFLITRFHFMGFLFYCIFFQRTSICCTKLPNARMFKMFQNSTVTNRMSYTPFVWRLSVAGGLAGGIATFIIYPIDTLKTIMQTDLSRGPRKKFLSSDMILNPKRMYAGILPAVIGAIPSSAIYFGGYEFTKAYLNSRANATISRPLINMISAGSGNILSSIIFVPKERIKQQLQAVRAGTVVWHNGDINHVNFKDISEHIWKTQGLKGF